MRLKAAEARLKGGREPRPAAPTISTSRNARAGRVKSHHRILLQDLTSHDFRHRPRPALSTRR